MNKIPRMICTRCGQSLPATDFYTDKGRACGYRPDCKKCHNIRQAERRLLWKDKPVITEKACSLCKEIKPISAFNKDVTAGSGYSPRCRGCAKVGKKMYQKEYRKDHNRERRIYNIKTTLNISHEEATVLVDRSMTESCEICQKKERNGRALAIDHCHKTGQIRGLLCHNCNVMIGHSFDNPAIIANAIKFLEREQAILQSLGV